MGLADPLPPPQAPEMSGYSADQEITSICADFLVVRAVWPNRSPIGLTSPAAKNSLASANLSGNLPGSGFFDRLLPLRKPLSARVNLNQMAQIP
jgi:hypothetical protein